MEAVLKPKRGLSALLAATTTSHEPEIPANEGPVLTNAIRAAEVATASIRANPNQPRTHFDPEALAELAASIKARGLIQPVVVRELRLDEVVGEAKYELIAGERRWRASQIAGLSAVPAVIKQVFQPQEILLLSLVENLQRDNLNPVEEALAYDRLAKTFSFTHEQIADGVGKSRATISNSLRLLDLPSSVLDALKMGKLTTGHAKVLLSIPDPKIQTQLAAKAQAENLTVKDLERLIVGAQKEHAGLPETAPREKNTRNTRVAPPHVQEIERQLREHFGTRVTVEEGLRKGRIILEFYSVEDFDRVVGLMGLEG